MGSRSPWGGVQHDDLARTVHHHPGRGVPDGVRRPQVALPGPVRAEPLVSDRGLGVVAKDSLGREVGKHLVDVPVQQPVLGPHADAGVLEALDGTDRGASMADSVPTATRRSRSRRLKHRSHAGPAGQTCRRARSDARRRAGQRFMDAVQPAVFRPGPGALGTSGAALTIGALVGLFAGQFSGGFVDRYGPGPAVVASDVARIVSFGLYPFAHSAWQVMLTARDRGGLAGIGLAVRGGSTPVRRVAR